MNLGQPSRAKAQESSFPLSSQLSQRKYLSHDKDLLNRMLYIAKSAFLAIQC